MRVLKSKYTLAAVVVLIILGVSVAVFVSRRSAPVPAPTVTVETGPKHVVIGTSVQGRTIDAYSYGSGKTDLLFAGGMHGGYEWNSVLLAYQFMDYLEANPSVIPANLTITVVPSINPDGVYKVIGKEGRFMAADVPASADQSPGRFNAHGVDLNRNFDCRWQPTSMWRNKVVSAGTAPFSEPEAKAIRDFVVANHPVAAIFWHSQANAVYASECEKGILPQTISLMNAYASAAHYPAVQSFDSYAVTGDSEGWLASIGIPAITVELQTHETVEWERNLAGIRAILNYYQKESE